MGVLENIKLSNSNPHLSLHEYLTCGPKKQVDKNWMSLAQMGSPYALPKFEKEMKSVDHF